MMEAIEEKKRAFRLEIRQRSTLKKMDKIRYSYWLHNQNQYNQLSEKLLYLVACCKFSQPNHQSRSYFLNQILVLVKECYGNWNAYIVLVQQMIELNFFSILCQKAVDIQYICELGWFIILNKRYVHEIQNQNWKAAVEENRHKLIIQCCQSLFLNLVIHLNYKINTNNKLDSVSIPKDRQNINRIIQLISQLMIIGQEKIKISEIVTPTVAQFMQFQHPITHLYLYILINPIENEMISKYLHYVDALMDIHDKFYESSRTSETETEEEKIKARKTKISSQTMKIFKILFANENIKHQYAQNAQNIIILLKILRKCQLYNKDWFDIVDCALFSAKKSSYGISNKESSQVQIENQAELTIQSINLMSYLCFEQSWICYSHLRQYILFFLHRIKYEQQIHTNIFTADTHLSPIPSYHRHKIPKHCENMLINIIINLLKNQYQHHCHYDYYEMMAIVFDDLYEYGMLKKWATDWRCIQNYQYLFESLLNVKKTDMKEYLIEISENLKESKNVNSGVKKKIRLTKNILMAEKKNSRIERGLPNFKINLTDSLQFLSSDQSQQSDDGEFY